MFLRIGEGWKLAGMNTFVTLLKGKPQGVYGTAGGGVLITHEHWLWIQTQVRSRPLTSNAAHGKAGERTVRSSAIAMLLVLGGGGGWVRRDHITEPARRSGTVQSAP